MDETEDARVAEWAAELRWIGDRMAEELADLELVGLLSSLPEPMFDVLPLNPAPPKKSGDQMLG